MISLALVADAIIGNVQEKTIKLHNASNSEVFGLDPIKIFSSHLIFSGGVIQLLHRICVFVLFGGCVHGHCVCDPLLLLLSQANLWLCIYIFHHWLLRYPGMRSFLEAFAFPR